MRQVATACGVGDAGVGQIEHPPVGAAGDSPALGRGLFERRPHAGDRRADLAVIWRDVRERPDRARAQRHLVEEAVGTLDGLRYVAILRSVPTEDWGGFEEALGVRVGVGVWVAHRHAKERALATESPTPVAGRARRADGVTLPSDRAARPARPASDGVEAGRRRP